MGASIVDLANAIATMEGYYKVGSLANRNNNPGNLIVGIGQIGTDSKGFAVFANASDGWLSLIHI